MLLTAVRHFCLFCAKLERVEKWNVESERVSENENQLKFLFITKKEKRENRLHEKEKKLKKIAFGNF